MKRFLLPLLICPACLPREEPLTLAAVDRESGDDITSGRLDCPRCRHRFAISAGIARLLPEPEGGAAGSTWRYEDSEMVARYLWSHYADLSGVPANGAANDRWAGLLTTVAAPALDAGCAVGRLSFAMANRSAWTVGCDLSASFVTAARRLARERVLTFSLPLEGNLRETFRVTLPTDWRSDNVEFVVADALRLPFAKGAFSQASTLNLLDRVTHPLGHLFELNRVTARTGARLLFASPFSWGSDYTPETRWLGGTASGEFSGSGLDNVRLLLQGRGKILAPPWQIAASGAVEWRMRSHRNHQELINSHYLVAER